MGNKVNVIQSRVGSRNPASRLEMLAFILIMAMLAGLAIAIQQNLLIRSDRPGPATAVFAPVNFTGVDTQVVVLQSQSQSVQSTVAGTYLGFERMRFRFYAPAFGPPAAVAVTPTAYVVSRAQGGSAQSLPLTLGDPGVVATPLFLYELLKSAGVDGTVGRFDGQVAPAAIRARLIRDGLWSGDPALQSALESGQVRLELTGGQASRWPNWARITINYPTGPATGGRQVTETITERISALQ